MPGRGPPRLHVLLCLLLRAPLPAAVQVQLESHCNWQDEYGLFRVQNCSATTQNLEISCGSTEAVHVTSFQAGTPDLQILLGPDAPDVLLKLLEDGHPRCVLGDGCLLDAPCANSSHYCHRYRGMELHYGVEKLPGERRKGTRSIKVRGALTRAMSLALTCTGKSLALLDYSFRPFPGCQDPLKGSGCWNCSDFAGCHEHDDVACRNTQGSEEDNIPATSSLMCMHRKQMIIGAIPGGEPPSLCSCCHLPYNEEPVDFGTAISLGIDHEVRLAVRHAYHFFFDWLNGERGGLCLGGERRPARLRLLGAENAKQVERATEQLVLQHGVKLLLSPYGSTLTEPAAKVADRQGAVMVAGTSSKEEVYTGRPRVFGVLQNSRNTLRASLELFSTAATPAPSSQAQAAAGAGSGGKERSMLGVLTQAGVNSRACDWVAQQGKVGGNPWDWVGATELTSTAPESEMQRQVAGLLEGAGSRGVLLACVASSKCNGLLAAVEASQLPLRAIVLTSCVVTQTFDLARGRFVLGSAAWQESMGFQTAAPSVDHPFKNAADWAAVFRRLFGNDESVVPYQAASTWASCVALVSAMEAAGSTEPSSVATALLNTSLRTIFGEVTFNDNGQNPGLMSIMQYQGSDNVARVVAPKSAATSEAVYPLPPLPERPCWVKSPPSAMGFTQVNGHYCHNCLQSLNPMRSVWNETVQQRICVACPEGQDAYEDALQATVCVKTCPSGSGLVDGPDGENVCKQCAAGRFAGAGACQDCPLGTYANASGSTACLPCPLGSFGGALGTACELCPVGKAATQERSTKCRSCSRGTYTNKTGSDSCSLCDAGTMAENREATGCVTCTPGTYSAWGAQSCDLCDVGKYQNMEKRSQCIQGVGLGATFDRTGLREGKNKARYWARHEEEYLTWEPCTRAPEACLTEERCAEGSTGYQCQACLPGYGHVWQRGEYSCFTCPSMNQNCAVMSCAVVVVVAVVYWLARNASRGIKHPQDIRMMLGKFLVFYFLMAGVCMQLMVELGQEFLYSPQTLKKEGVTIEHLDRLADLIFFVSIPLRSFPGFTLAAESSFWSIHCLLQPSRPEITAALGGLYHRDFYNASYAHYWKELRDFQEAAEFRVIAFWALWPICIAAIVYLLAVFLVVRSVYGRSEFFHQAFNFYDDLLEIGPEEAIKARTQDAWTAYVQTYRTRIAGLWWIVHQAEAVYKHRVRCLNWAEFHREGLPLLHALIIICQGGALEGVMRAANCSGMRMVYANMLYCGWDIRYSFNAITDVATIVYGIIVPLAIFVHTKLTRLQAQPEMLCLVTRGYSFHGWYWEPFLLFIKFLVIYLAHMGGDPEVKNGLLLLLGMAYAISSMVLQPFQKTHNGLCDLLNGYFILLWVFTTICTSAMHLIVTHDDPQPWLVAALVCVVSIFHYGFLLQIFLHFYRQSLDSFLMTIDVKVWGRSLEEPRNRNLLTIFRRRVLHEYVSQLMRRPYVGIYSDFSWVTVCGNRGDQAVIPELPQDLEHKRLPDLSDTAPAPLHPATKPARERHKQVLQASLESAVNLVIEVVGTPCFSISLLEFVVRAGMMFGIEHEKRQRQLSSIHRRLVSPEPAHRLTQVKRLEEAATVAVSHDPMDLLGTLSDVEAPTPKSAAAAAGTDAMAALGSNAGPGGAAPAKPARTSLWRVAKSRIRKTQEAENEEVADLRKAAEEVRDQEFMRNSTDAPMIRQVSLMVEKHKLSSQAFNTNVMWWDSIRGTRRRLGRMRKHFADMGKKSMPNVHSSASERSTLSKSSSFLGRILEGDGPAETPTVRDLMGDVAMPPEVVHKCKRRLEAMFSPSCFQRGIALSSLELGLMDLVAVPPNEMQHWLDRFEECWVRNKDIQSITAKRRAGLVEDSGVQTVVIREEAKPKPKENLGSQADPYTVSYLPKLGIMPPPQNRSTHGKRTMISNASAEVATQTNAADLQELEDGSREEMKRLSWRPAPVAPMKDRSLAATINWGQIVMKASLPDIHVVGPLLKARSQKSAEELQEELKEAKITLQDTVQKRRQVEKANRAGGAVRGGGFPQRPSTGGASSSSAGNKELKGLRKGLYED